MNGEALLPACSVVVVTVTAVYVYTWGYVKKFNIIKICCCQQKWQTSSDRWWIQQGHNKVCVCKPVQPFQKPHTHAYNPHTPRFIERTGKEKCMVVQWQRKRGAVCILCLLNTNLVVMMTKGTFATDSVMIIL